MAWFREYFSVSVAVLSAFCLLGAAPAPAALRVVVTIKPVHSLAAAILVGVAEPKLLLEGAASPHAYALKPSDARALSEADAVIFVSGNLEVFLGKALEALPANARIVDLETTPGLRLLPVREGLGHSPGAHEAEEAEEDEDHGGHVHNKRGTDVHFWLDPVNAIAMSRRLAQEFAVLDPAHAAQFQANAVKLEASLAALDAELKATLAGL